MPLLWFGCVCLQSDVNVVVVSFRCLSSHPHSLVNSSLYVYMSSLFVSLCARYVFLCLFTRYYYFHCVHLNFILTVILFLCYDRQIATRTLLETLHEVRQNATDLQRVATVINRFADDPGEYEFSLAPSFLSSLYTLATLVPPGSLNPSALPLALCLSLTRLSLSFSDSSNIQNQASEQNWLSNCLKSHASA